MLRTATGTGRAGASSPDGDGCGARDRDDGVDVGAEAELAVGADELVADVDLHPLQRADAVGANTGPTLAAMASSLPLAASIVAIAASSYRDPVLAEIPIACQAALLDQV